MSYNRCSSSFFALKEMLQELDILYFPLLSRKVQQTENSVVETTRINLIYSIARSVAHPINYKGNPDKKPGIACGLSWINKEELLLALKVKPKTLNNLLDKGVKLGFWRRTTQDNGFIKFSLRNPQKIARENLGIVEAGNFCSISLEDFNNIHVFTTEMVAISFQERSYYAAKIEANKNKKKIFRPGPIIFKKKPQRRQVPGKPRQLSSRYVGIDGSIVPYGVSHKRIAELTGRSLSTVSNHLNNKWRAAHGIYELPKRQFAILTGLNPDALMFDDDLDSDFYFVIGNDVYSKSNSVYFDQAGWNTKKPRIYKDSAGSSFSSFDDVLEQPPATPKNNKSNTSDNGSNSPPENNNTNNDDGKPSRPLSEVLFEWERLKGVPRQVNFFEKLDSKEKQSFLESRHAYPFLNKNGKVITPPISKKETNDSSDDFYIHLLDFASACNNKDFDFDAWAASLKPVQSSTPIETKAGSSKKPIDSLPVRKSNGKHSRSLDDKFIPTSPTPNSPSTSLISNPSNIDSDQTLKQLDLLKSVSNNFNFFDKLDNESQQKFINSEYSSYLKSVLDFNNKNNPYSITNSLFIKVLNFACCKSKLDFDFVSFFVNRLLTDCDECV